MLSPADLPSRMSSTPAKRARKKATQFARRFVIKGLLGLSLPAALLTTSLPTAQPAIGATAASAAAFAMTSTGAGMVGDTPISADGLAEIAAANILSGTMDFGAPASAPSRATTNNHAVNLRSGPGTKYTVLTSLKRGAAVDVTGRDGSWYKVMTASGKSGWILGMFLSLNGAAAPAVAAAAAPAAPAASRAATTASGRVNLRKGPGTNYGSYGKMALGTALTLVARSGDWIQVRSPRGTLGWVRSDLVKASSQTLAALPVATNVPQAAAPVAATSAAPAQQLAAPVGGRVATATRVALAQVGRRYVWGGASPRGFDCSGLVVYAYRAAGLALPHSSRAMFNTRYGARVGSMGALRAGDLVFFANTSRPGISHVALYVGGGRMVTANSPSTGVVLQSINTRYWRSHYAGAIRPY